MIERIWLRVGVAYDIGFAAIFNSDADLALNFDLSGFGLVFNSGPGLGSGFCSLSRFQFRYRYWFRYIKMVRTYKKKSCRGCWFVESMKQAIEAVLSKSAGYRKAAQLHGVPQTTLERHVLKIRKGEDLSIRKLEATSAARAMGFNKVAVNKFYSLLGEVYDKYNLTSDRIYNCDETGISSVSKTKSKIIAKKERKQVGSLSSAERGQTITVEICFNAAGTYMPPMLIFPRQRMKPELLDRAPPGTTAECNARGWMTTETFISWFQWFVNFFGASITNPVLLLLDGHVTHTENIEINQNAHSDFLSASTTDIPITNDEPETASSTAEMQQPLSPTLEEVPLEPVLPAISTHLQQKTPVSELQPGPTMPDENSVSRSPIRRSNKKPNEKKLSQRENGCSHFYPYKNELEKREELKRTKQCSNPNDPRLKKIQNKTQKQNTRKSRSDAENAKEDVLCIYCVDSKHTYLKSSERWVRSR
ncbi:hypothetical protein EVAR_16953_1 [Eumeta japonica]|uniref:HTH psq-type domain-containing protein n=1 Tax=Eumeta variegata TaxID=151549 RepID=A0A4C1TVR9_EUMVA|nr:hypothetical protein EVAR_16953_1 [Eumeta japonica]